MGSRAILFRDDSSKEEIQMHLGKAEAHIRKAMEMLTDEDYNERGERGHWDDEYEERYNMPPMYRGRRSNGRYM